MKHRTAELEGALLDAAVAKAIGLTVETALDFGLGCPDWLAAFKPSRSWLHGGPIIEREGIAPFSYMHAGERWWAAGMNEGMPFGTHNTKSCLVACMRCLVAHKLGEEVELP